VSVKLTTKNNNKYDLRDVFDLTMSIKTSGNIGGYWAGKFEKMIYVSVNENYS